MFNPETMPVMDDQGFVRFFVEQRTHDVEIPGFYVGVAPQDAEDDVEPESWHGPFETQQAAEDFIGAAIASAFQKVFNTALGE